MKFPVALQAYTIRDELERDYFSTLAQVANIGYAGIKLGPPPPGITVAELKAFLNQHELQFVATHILMEQLDQDVSAQIDYAEEVGTKYVVLSYRFDSRQAVLAAAERFNHIGATCHQRGLQFLYHNHNWEFTRFDGDYALDILLQTTDPELVKLELDTYWVKRGGEEPAEYLRKLHNRCPLLHIKDVEPGDEQFFAEVGEGILDFPTIVQEAAAAGTQWLVVEQDRSRRSPLDSIAISYRNLQRMGII